MKSRISVLGMLMVMIVLVGACAAPAAPVAPAPQATAAPPTAAPATPPTTGGGANAPITAATLALGKDATLGQFLVDDKGMSLYLYTKDDKNTSNCYDNCAKNWPPLLSAGQPTGMDGVNAALIGTTQRKDGATQVTYNGYPLYYYIKDAKAGDITGQNVGKVWYVISASGDMIKAATVKVGDDAKLGKFLADDQGRTLYMYTKDDKNTSNCYDACAKNWPPLLSAGQPTGLEGVDAALLGTTQRKDGTMEVTYNGYPLYYYIKDQKAGDTVGQGVGNVWYVLSPTGELIKQGPAAPTGKPDTGYGG